MSTLTWNATVVDSPASEPYAVVGDVMIAVRTPRSQDFVTVEVIPAPPPRRPRAPVHRVFKSPAPYPCMRAQWQGEVHAGDTVDFQVAEAVYHLTLSHIAESPDGFPWVICQFCLERD